MLFFLGMFALGAGAIALDFGSSNDSLEHEAKFASSEGDAEQETTEVAMGNEFDFLDIALESDAEEPTEEPDELSLVVGTDQSDVIAGVNAHSDEATGIVSLYGETAEALFGGDGDDIIALGAGDIANGGDGDDEFLVDGQLTGAEIALGQVPTIADFEPGNDIVCICMPTPEVLLEQTFPEHPDIDIELSFAHEDGETLVYVNEDLACKLVGIYDLTENDVHVDFDYHSDLKTDFEEQYGY